MADTPVFIPSTAEYSKVYLPKDSRTAVLLGSHVDPQTVSSFGFGTGIWRAQSRTVDAVRGQFSRQRTWVGTAI